MEEGYIKKRRILFACKRRSQRPRMKFLSHKGTITSGNGRRWEAIDNRLKKKKEKPLRGKAWRYINKRIGINPPRLLIAFPLCELFSNPPRYYRTQGTSGGIFLYANKSCVNVKIVNRIVDVSIFERSSTFLVRQFRNIGII